MTPTPDQAKGDKKLSQLTDADYERCRKYIEDVLVDWRDNRLSVMRNNGLVIRERDGKDSSIIRLGFDDAMRMAIKHLLGTDGKGTV